MCLYLCMCVCVPVGVCLYMRGGINVYEMDDMCSVNTLDEKKS